MTVPELDKLVSMVDERLRRTDLGRSFDLRVERDVTREDAPWVFVGVAPHRPGVRPYELAELLARVEQDVRKESSKQEIMLLPVRFDTNGNGVH